MHFQWNLLTLRSSIFPLLWCYFQHGIPLWYKPLFHSFYDRMQDWFPTSATADLSRLQPSWDSSSCICICGDQDWHSSQFRASCWLVFTVCTKMTRDPMNANCAEIFSSWVPCIYEATYLLHTVQSTTQFVLTYFCSLIPLPPLSDPETPQTLSLFYTLIFNACLGKQFWSLTFHLVDFEFGEFDVSLRHLLFPLQWFPVGNSLCFTGRFLKNKGSLCWITKVNVFRLVFLRDHHHSWNCYLKSRTVSFWAILRLAGITSLGGAAYALLCRFFYKKLKAPRSVQADRICSPEIYGIFYFSSSIFRISDPHRTPQRSNKNEVRNQLDPPPLHFVCYLLSSSRHRPTFLGTNGTVTNGPSVILFKCLVAAVGFRAFTHYRCFSAHVWLGPLAPSPHPTSTLGWMTNPSSTRCMARRQRSTIEFAEGLRVMTELLYSEHPSRKFEINCVFIFFWVWNNCVFFPLTFPINDHINFQANTDHQIHIEYIFRSVRFSRAAASAAI